MNDVIYENMQKHEKFLSKYACSDKSCLYLKENNDDIRTPYFHDIDRIIYSLSYIRYMGKTQVFSNIDNDHIQTRMLHVSYVSKIARTIGRALNLNEDLIEAASLGHDLGHTPYGHEGERILNNLSLKHNEGYFMHNINSIRNLLFIENYGNGQNISIQVLDAIMCHNGEILNSVYYPKKKTKEDFLNEYNMSYKDINIAKKLCPMTLEGCVVRISDIIAYIGRDIEDGIRKNLISYSDIPKDITSILGTTNREIINTIVCDIIKNSYDKPYIKMSDDIFKAIFKLKDFNYKNIYYKALTNEERKEIENKFEVLFNTYLSDIKKENKTSIIYKSYLDNMCDEYKKNTPERIVIDYISGMTDEYLNKQYENIIKNK